jgi:hypothetical protein
MNALPHGAVVTVVAEEWVEVEASVYAQVERAGERGWLRANYLKR